MSAILAVLFLLPALGRPADSKTLILKRLKEIERESAPVMAEADEVIRDIAALQEEYETTSDPALISLRRGSTLQKAEEIDEHADKLYAEYDALMNRIYGDMILDHVLVTQGGKDRDVDVTNIHAALGIRAFDMALHESRKNLRGVLKKDKELYRAVVETARVRRRVRRLLGGIVFAAVFAGVFVWRRKRRKADIALSGPAS